MTPKILASLVASTFIFSSPAFAHSDYWRCAAASGSNEAAEANCGTRADYDNRQANDAAADSARRQAEQQQQDENDRQARQRRDDDERQADETRRRQAADQEEADRNAANRSYEDNRSSSGGSSSRVARRKLTIPVSVNSHIVNRKISLASATEIARRNGYAIKVITLRIQAAGASTTKIMVKGQTIASLKTSKAGAASKSFALGKNAAGSGLSLEVQGDITLKTVTLTLVPR